MAISVCDRFRVLGGVRQISIDAILPIFLLPIMLGVAAINIYCTIVICVVMPLFLGYAQWLRKSLAPRTKFFFMWSLWSVIYLWLMFEVTVPLLELLPEENFIFITTMFLAIFCFYKVGQEQMSRIELFRATKSIKFFNYFFSCRPVKGHQKISLHQTRMTLKLHEMAIRRDWWWTTMK